MTRNCCIACQYHVWLNNHYCINHNICSEYFSSVEGLPNRVFCEDARTNRPDHCEFFKEIEKD